MMKKLKEMKRKFRKILTACFPRLETEKEKFRRKAKALLSPEEVFADGEITFFSKKEYNDRIEKLLDSRM